MARITVIGNAVIDVCARPVSDRVFRTGSLPAEEIRISYGGDALNEAVVLARFGKKVELIAKVGRDEEGSRIREHLGKAGVLTDKIVEDARTATSVNIVLVDERGERFFVTDPEGGQRRLTAEDVTGVLKPCGEIVSFASIFVSPLLDIPAMTKLFRAIKEEEHAILAADMTKAKKGERLEDLLPCLSYIDYLIPNEEEIALLTGERDPVRNAEILAEAGVGCSVIKCGANGCVLRTRDGVFQIPAYRVEKCVDTTGAGDCFAAGFLWALSEGWPQIDCACFACATASCAVERTGATEGVQSLAQVMERYREVKAAV